MKKKFTVSIFGFLAAFIVFSSFGDLPNHVLSTGAPPGHTGAPGELTCARTGCHDSGIPNSGNGTTTLLFNNGNKVYEPGKTYTITVTSNESDIERFGFEFTALSSSDLLNAGTISITDSTRTQVISGTNQFSGREYVTYRYAGTSPVGQGVGEWSFDWIAPDENKGNITFYLATVSANNDATDDGDQTYTSSLEIAPGTLSSEVFAASDNIIIFINNEYLRIHIFDSGLLNSLLKIYSIQGEVIYSGIIHKQQSSINNMQFASGIYFAKIEMKDKTIIKKFISTHN